jgi:lambda repressor-like predicted transcriptional regulator
VLKRKPHSKGTEKQPASNPEHEKKRPVGEPGRQPPQALSERHAGQYPHKSVPPGHGNNPDLLKYYLAQHFASPANLAREANVSRAAVSAVIHGRTRSERIERMIAKSCGRTLQELFPAWYPENK